MHRHCAKPFCGIGLFPFCLILLLLSGCATLNKEECLNADWYSIGYVDGARGNPASKIGQHRQACAEYSVRPDFDQYDKGRIAGLVEYCNPRNGYWLGTKGALYSGVCPKNLERPFIVAYQQGKNVYAMESQIKTGEKELRGTVQRNTKMSNVKWLTMKPSWLRTVRGAGEGYGCSTKSKRHPNSRNYLSLKSQRRNIRWKHCVNGLPG